MPIATRFGIIILSACFANVQRLKICVMLLAAAVLFGCSQGPSRVKVPKFDPQDSAAQAIAEYDSDGDGSLSKEELNRCPGLLSAIDRYDSDGNGAIDATEIASRIEQWFERRAGAMSVRARVMMDGKPLSGAKLELIPESFLGEAGIPAWGLTMRSGSAQLVIDQEQAPEAWKGIPGIPPGIYSIRIAHPDKKIPEKYNEQTTLGAEVAYESLQDGIVLNLKSR